MSPTEEDDRYERFNQQWQAAYQRLADKLETYSQGSVRRDDFERRQAVLESRITIAGQQLVDSAKENTSQHQEIRTDFNNKIDKILDALIKSDKASILALHEMEGRIQNITASGSKYIITLLISVLLGGGIVQVVHLWIGK
jgi:hypothetical protein